MGREGGTGGTTANNFQYFSRGNRMVSVSCFKRPTYRPLAVVVEKLRNLLSCLKFI